jgi:hypothetical protein
MHLKKHPVTPAGLKEDWAEIRPRMAAIKEKCEDEWFKKLLAFSMEWTDAELDKPKPVSPETAIDLVLNPLVKKSYFRALIKAEKPSVRNNIYRLREELAAFRKKCRMIEWLVVKPECLPP